MVSCTEGVSVLDDDGFDDFIRETEPRLRRALVAAYGPERGGEATAEALAYAWENWARVSHLANPAGYLFRVGQSRSRRRRQPIVLPIASDIEMPDVEPRLPMALAALSEQQRVVTVLVLAYSWTHREVAAFLEVGVSTVQTHLERGLAKMRAVLEVHEDAG